MNSQVRVQQTKRDACYKSYQAAIAAYKVFLVYLLKFFFFILKLVLLSLIVTSSQY